MRTVSSLEFLDNTVRGVVRGFKIVRYVGSRWGDYSGPGFLLEDLRTLGAVGAGTASLMSLPSAARVAV